MRLELLSEMSFHYADGLSWKRCRFNDLPRVNLINIIRKNRKGKVDFTVYSNIKVHVLSGSK